MKNILIIGCGGIGSFLCRELSRLILSNQIDLNEIQITIADNDIVEAKNIKYQNFKASDVFKNKAEVLSKKYCFNKIEGKITENNQLQNYDLIISAVDNVITRKMIFDYCNKINPASYFIDLRCTGRSIAFFTKDLQYQELIESLGNLNETKTHSCQNAFELEQGIIQNGNVIIATIASQLILNWLRGEINPQKLIMRI